MPEPDVNSLQVAIYGLGTIGALTIIVTIVNWLKLLLRWNGQRVRYLTALVAAYVVGMLFAASYYPPVALGMGALFLVAFLSTSADAFFHQSSEAVKEQEHS